MVTPAHSSGRPEGALQLDDGEFVAAGKPIMSAGPPGAAVAFTVAGSRVVGTPTCAASLAGTDIVRARDEPGVSDLREFLPRWPATPGTRVRVHVLNGFGMAIGDSLIGLQAASLLAERAQFVLWRPRARLHPGLERVYALAGFATRPLPIAVAELASMNGLRLDLSDYALRDGFASANMLDYFLERLGLDPASVPASSRAPSWLAKALPNPPRPPLREPYVLIAAGSSQPIRSMSAAEASALAAAIIGRTGVRVAGLGFELDHPRFAKADAWAPDFDSFVGLIANAEAMVSADSAAIHVAGAYAVATLGLFTTIDPDLRIRGYPNSSGLLLDPSAPYLGRHWHESREQLDRVAESWAARRRDIADASLAMMEAASSRSSIRPAAP